MMRNPFRGFLKKSDGATTVEVALWFPFIIAVFAFMVDVSMVVFGQAKVLNAVQEANREYSIGNLDSDTAASGYIESVLAKMDIKATAKTWSKAGVAYTVVEVPVYQLQVIGFFSAFNKLEIKVYTEHMKENMEA